MVHVTTREAPVTTSPAIRQGSVNVRFCHVARSESSQHATMFVCFRRFFAPPRITQHCFVDVDGALAIRWRERFCHVDACCQPAIVRMFIQIRERIDPTCWHVQPNENGEHGLIRADNT